MTQNFGAYKLPLETKKEWQSQTCIAAWTSILTGLGALFARGLGIDLLPPDLQAVILEYLVPITMLGTGMWARWGRRRATSVIK